MTARDRVWATENARAQNTACNESVRMSFYNITAAETSATGIKTEPSFWHPDAKIAANTIQQILKDAAPQQQQQQQPPHHSRPTSGPSSTATAAVSAFAPRIPQPQQPAAGAPTASIFTNFKQPGNPPATSVFSRPNSAGTNLFAAPAAPAAPPATGMLIPSAMPPPTTAVAAAPAHHHQQQPSYPSAGATKKPALSNPSSVPGMSFGTATAASAGRSPTKPRSSRGSSSSTATTTTSGRAGVATATASRVPQQPSTHTRTGSMGTAMNHACPGTPPINPKVRSAAVPPPPPTTGGMMAMPTTTPGGTSSMAIAFEKLNERIAVLQSELQKEQDQRLQLANRVMALEQIIREKDNHFY